MKPTTEEKQALAVQKKALSLAVTSPASAQRASNLLHDIKEAKHVLTEKKTAMTRPIMESLKQIKDFFAPYEQYLKVADEEVRAKLLAYEVSEKPVEAEEEATEGIQTQTRRVLEIVDETLLPRDYMIPDRMKITRALFDGIDVFGARLVEKEVLNVV